MLKSARKKEKDPEGRMSLGDHLRELRNRLAKAVLAIVVVTVVAAFFYKDMIEFFTEPILDAVGCEASFSELAKQDSGTCARIVLNGLLTPFTLALKVSLTAGVVLASPIWLYQLWAFIAPGLHRHEKKYALAFVAAGFPLFLGGALFAYLTLPTMATVLLDLSPENLDNQLPLDELLDLITRMVIVFGLSFELPLLLVMLNLTGMITGRRMIGWWRGMIMGITVFSALVTPSTDPLTMLALAGPICFLYFVAAGFSLVNDRRKARIAALGPSEDEASELDSPEEIEEVEAVASAPALPEQAGSDPHRVNGYDDVT
ncbi:MULTISPECIES: twin-arginine translocase subunit TatC [Streptomyces]|uniref:Sec-independent protein translocase protein TatC n=1 Tax=Streptomyces albus (strain ATCC 21838 / DSM 41398 / FERM P-419 / JCM 4703 / NBRC 107858) TaxID=1081613 RepID=A0A0B5F849_STRA4|nr:twin-arginine translocase subunit TatC [Streptomyces sp. SCSIO ZS0520]AJE86647.1 protein translocation system component [Streptomyces albus]AOU80951.1 protein translocation system component [Streptomyces albus]AYN36654.1 twin-arginine translocase subunit TatC [Streptomyces albus]